MLLRGRLLTIWQAMGIAVDLGPEGVARCVREAGVGFMMAPRYHPAMAAVVPVRRSLKVRREPWSIHSELLRLVHSALLCSPWISTTGVVRCH